MNEEESELQSLLVITERASVVQDGTILGVLMPGIRIQSPTGVEVMDAVLCPRGQGGYVTRLLLERRVQGRENLNWQQVMAFGRNWQTWSWQNVPAGQSWINVFAAHARVLR